MRSVTCLFTWMLGVLTVGAACSLTLFSEEPAGDADGAADVESGADADVVDEGEVGTDADVADEVEVGADADVVDEGEGDGDGEAGPACGNGATEPPEQCDDANDVPGDGCENDCTWSCETATECDDGEACNGEESCTGHVCGTGTPLVDGTTCTAGAGPGVCRAALCVLIHCGNSLVDPGEECDDGNLDNTDACLADCTAARCGDGFVRVSVEECDGVSARSCTTSCTTVGSEECTDCAWAGCVPPDEICNGSDDDCDTATDEGCGPLVWVANSALNVVQVVNTAVGGGAVATVPVGVSPQRLVFTPAGRELYVANQTANTVSVIDVPTRAVTATIVVGPGPRSMAVTPDGALVYVACTGGHTISVIGTATHAVVDTIDTGLAATVVAVAIRPGGTQLWTANDGYLKVFSLPTHSVVYTSGWTDGFVSGWARFLPDGSVFWAASGCGCCGNVQRYSGTTYAQLSDRRFGSPSTGLAMSPDGSAAYGGYWGALGGCSGPVTLVKMDGATGTVALSAPLTRPWAGGAVSSDGATLYLASYEDGVSVVDTASLAVLRTFPLGGTAEDVALPP
jgi:YVTN family beta-propeller protein/cysteine-rich repeat protein